LYPGRVPMVIGTNPLVYLYPGRVPMVIGTNPLVYLYPGRESNPHSVARTGF
jgi:LDH2 family malate/lactate/ureidoglycolate dehydrogenase